MTSTARGALRSSTLLRSLTLVVVVGAVLFLLTDQFSAYRNLQLASGAYYFCALAGLTVLAGSSGQVSLGHGAFMAVGAYTFALLNLNEQWSVFPALVASVVAALLIGIPVGAAASRLRGPYLAGATLAFAVGLPALADKFPSLFGGENGLAINPPIPPTWLGSNFPLERWEAWIACAGALIVVFVLYNVTHSGIGRSWRAVRDDEIAAALAGLRVGRRQTLAFAISAAARGARRRPPGRGDAARRPRLLPAPAVADAAHRRRDRRARVAGGGGLGSGAARAAPELDQRPRELVLAVDQRLPQSSDRDLRRRADRGDAGAGRAGSRAGCARSRTRCGRRGRPGAGGPRPNRPSRGRGRGRPRTRE